MGPTAAAQLGKALSPVLTCGKAKGDTMPQPEETTAEPPCLIELQQGRGVNTMSCSRSSEWLAIVQLKMPPATSCRAHTHAQPQPAA